MARALRDAGVRVRVYTLGENEFHEAALREAGLGPTGVGRAANPVLRAVTFAYALRSFRPHIVQAAHAYVNLYVALASRLYRSLAIGAIRGDAVDDVRDIGRWGRLLLQLPHALLTNSYTAQRNAAGLGADPAAIHVVPNVIDSSIFEARDRHLREDYPTSGHGVVVVLGSLLRLKRLDRFLEALALARREVPGLKALVVGEGPERLSLEALAHGLALLPEGLEFRGACDDVPGLLAEASMLALTSDHEGLPNVILEAMAARLPVVTTPAGDAGLVVQDGVTGYVVPFESVEVLAERMVRLARLPDLRRKLGEAGRAHVREHYACAGLADRLLSVYRAVALRRGRHHVLAKLPPRRVQLGSGETPGI